MSFVACWQVYRSIHVLISSGEEEKKLFYDKFFSFFFVWHKKKLFSCVSLNEGEHRKQGYLRDTRKLFSGNTTDYDDLDLNNALYIPLTEAFLFFSFFWEGNRTKSRGLELEVFYLRLLAVIFSSTISDVIRLKHYSMFRRENYRCINENSSYLARCETCKVSFNFDRCIRSKPWIACS